MRAMPNLATQNGAKLRDESLGHNFLTCHFVFIRVTPE